MRKMIVIATLALLSACANNTPSVGTPTASGSTNQAVAAGVTPQAQATANWINAAYALVKGGVNVYVSLAPCTDAKSTKLCSNPAIVLQLQKALVVADDAVNMAVNSILNPTTNPTSLAALTSDALMAIGVLTKTATIFGVAL